MSIVESEANGKLNGNGECFVVGSIRVDLDWNVAILDLPLE